jgi:hypothetical protein
LAYFGLPVGDAVEKDAMRQLAIRGGPFTDVERTALLDYCQADVDALGQLLPAMLPYIDLPRALLRGRYMCAVARMEWVGVPVDAPGLERLRAHWDAIKAGLIDATDPAGEIFVQTGRRFNPGTACGAAVLTTAAENLVDPGRLADAVDWLYELDRAAVGELAEGVEAARKETGLTVARVARCERASIDWTTQPGFDAAARALVRQHPALGVGVSEDDYVAALWERLGAPTSSTGRKYSAERLRRGIELLAGNPNADKPSGPRSFSAARFAEYLVRRGIAWPRLPSGALALDDDTFREMARSYPAEIGPIRELRYALGQLRLNDLAVGLDGRNRCLLSPFGSRTGRNQPSNAKFIFGPSAWIRFYIRPWLGMALAYIDWSQQELAIAAALSGDENMKNAYISGDFYLTFAKMAGSVPMDATKQTHAAVREQFKVVALGVLYGLSSEGLARKLNVPACHGRELLALHQRTFGKFWEWSQATVDRAMLMGWLQTCFGWTLHVGPGANPRSVANFPMQAHGAEMMRLAACLATERGIRVCAPVHDAFLIESEADAIKSEAERMQAAMCEASEVVLPGFPLRSEVKIIRHPDRYVESRGERFWNLVQRLLQSAEQGAQPAVTDHFPEAETWPQIDRGGSVQSDRPV